MQSPYARAALGAALIAFGAPALAGITDIVDFQGVNAYESTYSIPHAPDFFGVGDGRLTAVLAGSALNGSSRDFGHFPGDENYDIYFSNADGTLNANGSYITIDGNCFVAYNCFNINEVSLVVNGSEQFATSVVRSIYGRAGSFTPGSHVNAADGNMFSFTQLGDTIGLGDEARMSITLEFANVPSIPEPQTTVLLALGLGVLGWTARHRRG